MCQLTLHRPILCPCQSPLCPAVRPSERALASTKALDMPSHAVAAQHVEPNGEFPCYILSWTKSWWTDATEEEKNSCAVCCCPHLEATFASPPVLASGLCAGCKHTCAGTQPAWPAARPYAVVGRGSADEADTPRPAVGEGEAGVLSGVGAYKPYRSGQSPERSESESEEQSVGDESVEDESIESQSVEESTEDQSVEGRSVEEKTLVKDQSAKDQVAEEKTPVDDQSTKDQIRAG